MSLPEPIELQIGFQQSYLQIVAGPIKQIGKNKISRSVPNLSPPTPRHVTHVDNVVHVTYEQVPQDASLIELSQRDHVLHTLNGSRVHAAHLPLAVHPQLSPVVVHHLRAAGLCLEHPGADGDGKLAIFLWVQPHEVVLQPQIL